MSEREKLTVDEARIRPHLRDASPLLERWRMLKAQAQARYDHGPTVASSAVLKPEPGELRGIPVQAPGVGGVSPGSSPGSEAHLARMDRRRRVVIDGRAA